MANGKGFLIFAYTYNFKKMFRTISSILVGLLFCLTFVSCEKEYSAELGSGAGGTTGGTAVFTLDGAPDLCTDPEITGTYAAGTAMGAANQVLIAVEVTTVGTYTITSNQANGVTFAGAGTFTSTGLNFIALQATGTPTAAGTFNFKPGKDFCTFPITFTGGAAAAVYTLNCATPDIAAANYTAGTTITGTANTVKLKANVTTAGAYNITTVANGITFTAAGTFAATGNDQVITFVASGTPTAASAGTVFTVGAGGCTFTIPVQGANTSAYTITCTSATAATGTYTTNTAITGTANTVGYTVNVTALGTYNVTTSTNGITFTAAGNFTTLGNQPITLVASGTPTLAGVNTFTIGTSGCSFDVTVVAGTAPSTDYIRCKIGTATTVTTFDQNALGTQQTQSGFTFLDFAADNSTTADFEILLTNTGSTIPTGDYNPPSILNFTRFCTPIYTDASSNEWGLRDPTQSNTFKVTVSTITTTRVTGTFSGTLYSNGGTGTTTLAISSGEFSIPIQ